MCYYFDNAFCQPQATIDVVCHELKNPKYGHIDLIVGTGLSGVLLLVPISMKSGIPFAVVRKASDIEKSSLEGGCHSGALVELQDQSLLTKQNLRFVIIDDFASSGDTVARVSSSIKRQLEQIKPEFAGLIFYQTDLSWCPEGVESVPTTGLHLSIEAMKDHVRESVIVRGHLD